MGCMDRITGPSAMALTLLALGFALAAPAAGQDAGTGAAVQVVNTADRVPGNVWLRYANVTEAGFSPDRLAAARRFWERRGAAAFLAVSRGAVVAAWGDVDRRFPTHSMRKSFLSALYGVYRDDIDLDRTLAELGIDDVPALTGQEKQARIVDLIRSRSGVYHPAAAEPMEMSSARPERGSHLPGTYWWYNNWDFNVAGTIFERLTGEDIFEAFDETIARPIAMQDFRLIDGFYHYEPEKSDHPAYLFRMSTRDLARFGLLFARGGRWGSAQVVPADWVAESTRSHSEIDLGKEYGTGYGYMWWVEGTRGFAARGYGGHVLAIYPEIDLVMVVRADTYHDRFVSNRAIAGLFKRVAAAGGGARSDDPRLVPLPSSRPDTAPAVELSAEQQARYTGEFELPSGRAVTVASADGVLTIDYGLGVYRLLPESETQFLMEDARDPVVFDLGSDGRATGVRTEQLAYLEAQAAVSRGSPEAAVDQVRMAVATFPESSRVHYNFARALSGTGKADEALAQLRIALSIDPDYGDASSLLRRLLIRRYAWLIGAIGLMIVAAWGLWRRRSTGTA